MTSERNGLRTCHRGRDFELWPNMSRMVIKDAPSLRHLLSMTFLYFELLGSSKSFSLTRSVPFSLVYFQVKPMSIGMSAGGPDKSQSKRVGLWTKNVLEYTQSLLDDLCQTGGASGSHSQILSVRGDSVENEPDLLAKWRYIVSLEQWHYIEGLLNRTQVVDWALKQLQEKESVEALELLLPILLELIDGISMSQTHSRMLVELCLQWLRKLYPLGHVPSIGDNSRNNQVADTLVKLLQYLVLVIPDTFVALDCFPLPQCVSLGGSESSAIESSSNDLGRVNSVVEDRSIMYAKGKRKTYSEVGVVESVDLIEKRNASLASAVSPTLLRNNEGKIVQALDKAHGNITSDNKSFSSNKVHMCPMPLQ
ncbi:mediator of RNA polymerase II transcription subunit 12 [Physcomitrium patens]|uniref:mediator of RNA polymerase II transcription subunit 12 n=1 Tax=Physcomitrium patens TaxID=3218 RepID=UPI003CCE0399